MPKAFWALDIGGWSLKVVKGVGGRGAGKITIEDFDVIPYGELRCGLQAEPIERFREALRTFRDRYTVQKSDGMGICVSGSEVFSRFINLPPVLESLDQIIRYEARQQIPFDMDNVVWDYQPVKEEHELGEEIEVGIFALKRERAEELMELFEPWQRNLCVLQDAPLAVYNFLRFEGHGDKPLIVLAAGARTTDIVIMNQPRFWIRSMLAGGNDITAALQKSLEIDYAEAERVKQKTGQRAGDPRMLRTVKPVGENLVRAIQRSLGYYKDTYRDVAPGVKLDRILALGGAFKFAPLGEMLAQGLQYEMDEIRQLNNFELAGGVDRIKFMGTLAELCPALGVLVQGFQRGAIRINLVPEEVLAAAELNTKKPWFAAAAAGVLLSAVVLFLGAKLRADDLKKDEGLGAAQVERLESARRQYEAKKAEVEEVKTKLAALTTARVDRNLYLKILPQVVNALPPDIYLRRIEFRWVEPAEIEQSFHPSKSEGATFGAAASLRRERPGEPDVTTPSGRKPGESDAEEAGLRERDVAGLTAEEERQRRQLPRRIGSGARVRVGSEDVGPPSPWERQEQQVMEDELRRREAARGGRPTAETREPGPEMGGPAGEAVAGEVPVTTALVSENSKLVMIFWCESSHLEETTEYVGDFIDRMSTVEQESRPLFEEVGLVGGFTDVFRSSVDGSQVSSLGAPGGRRLAGGAEDELTLEEEKLQFVAFIGYAVIRQTGETEPGAQEAS